MYKILYGTRGDITVVTGLSGNCRELEYFVEGSHIILCPEHFQKNRIGKYIGNILFIERFIDIAIFLVYDIFCGIL